MTALAALLDEQEQQESMAMYQATVLWTIGKRLYGKEYLPQYNDLTKQTPEDPRTAEELVDDLAAKIRQRIEQRRREP